MMRAIATITIQFALSPLVLACLVVIPVTSLSTHVFAEPSYGANEKLSAIEKNIAEIQKNLAVNAAAQKKAKERIETERANVIKAENILRRAKEQGGKVAVGPDTYLKSYEETTFTFRGFAIELVKKVDNVSTAGGRGSISIRVYGPDPREPLVEANIRMNEITGKAAESLFNSHRMTIKPGKNEQLDKLLGDALGKFASGGDVRAVESFMKDMVKKAVTYYGADYPPQDSGQVEPIPANFQIWGREQMVKIAHKNLQSADAELAGLQRAQDQLDLQQVSLNTQKQQFSQAAEILKSSAHESTAKQSGGNTSNGNLPTTTAFAKISSYSDPYTQAQVEYASEKNGVPRKPVGWAMPEVKGWKDMNPQGTALISGVMFDNGDKEYTVQFLPKNSASKAELRAQPAVKISVDSKGNAQLISAGSQALVKDVAAFLSNSGIGGWTYGGSGPLEDGVTKRTSWPTGFVFPPSSLADLAGSIARARPESADQVQRDQQQQERDREQQQADAKTSTTTVPATKLPVSGRVSQSTMEAMGLLINYYSNPTDSNLANAREIIKKVIPSLIKQGNFAEIEYMGGELLKIKDSDKDSYRQKILRNVIARFSQDYPPTLTWDQAIKVGTKMVEGLAKTEALNGSDGTKTVKFATAMFMDEDYHGGRESAKLGPPTQKIVEWIEGTAGKTFSAQIAKRIVESLRDATKKQADYFRERDKFQIGYASQARDFGNAVKDFDVLLGRIETIAQKNSEAGVPPVISPPPDKDQKEAAENASKDKEAKEKEAKEKAAKDAADKAAAEKAAKEAADKSAAEKAKQDAEEAQRLIAEEYQRKQQEHYERMRNRTPQQKLHDSRDIEWALRPLNEQLQKKTGISTSLKGLLIDIIGSDYDRMIALSGDGGPWKSKLPSAIDRLAADINNNKTVSRATLEQFGFALGLNTAKEISAAARGLYGAYFGGGDQKVLESFSQATNELMALPPEMDLWKPEQERVAKAAVEQAAKAAKEAEEQKRIAAAKAEEARVHVLLGSVGKPMSEQFSGSEDTRSFLANRLGANMTKVAADLTAGNSALPGIISQISAEMKGNPPGISTATLEQFTKALGLNTAGDAARVSQVLQSSYAIKGNPDPRIIDSFTKAIRLYSSVNANVDLSSSQMQLPALMVTMGEKTGLIFQQTANAILGGELGANPEKIASDLAAGKSSLPAVIEKMGAEMRGNPPTLSRDTLVQFTKALGFNTMGDALRVSEKLQGHAGWNSGLGPAFSRAMTQMRSLPANTDFASPQMQLLTLGDKILNNTGINGNNIKSFLTDKLGVNADTIAADLAAGKSNLPAVLDKMGSEMKGNPPTLSAASMEQFTKAVGLNTAGDAARISKVLYDAYVSGAIQDRNVFTAFSAVINHFKAVPPNTDLSVLEQQRLEQQKQAERAAAEAKAAEDARIAAAAKAEEDKKIAAAKAKKDAEDKRIADEKRALAEKAAAERAAANKGIVDAAWGGPPYDIENPDTLMRSVRRDNQGRVLSKQLDSLENGKIVQSVVDYTYQGSSPFPTKAEFAKYIRDDAGKVTQTVRVIRTYSANGTQATEVKTVSDLRNAANNVSAATTHALLSATPTGTTQADVAREKALREAADKAVKDRAAAKEVIIKSWQGPPYDIEKPGISTTNNIKDSLGRITNKMMEFTENGNNVTATVQYEYQDKSKNPIRVIFTKQVNDASNKLVDLVRVIRTYSFNGTATEIKTSSAASNNPELQQLSTTYNMKPTPPTLTLTAADLAAEKDAETKRLAAEKDAETKRLAAEQAAANLAAAKAAAVKEVTKAFEPEMTKAKDAMDKEARNLEDVKTAWANNPKFKKVADAQANYDRELARKPAGKNAISQHERTLNNYRTVLDNAKKDTVGLEAQRQSAISEATKKYDSAKAAYNQVEKNMKTAQAQAEKGAEIAEAKRVGDAEKDKQAAAETKRLADEQASKDAEIKRLADEQAAKDAEAKRLADEQAAKAAETKRLADEQAAKDAETKRLADEQTAKDAEAKRLADEQAAKDAETKRLADEQAAKAAEKKRLAEEQRLAEEAKTKQAAEDQRLAEVAKAKQAAEEQRLAEEVKAVAEQEAAEQAAAEKLASDQEIGEKLIAEKTDAEKIAMEDVLVAQAAANSAAADLAVAEQALAKMADAEKVATEKAATAQVAAEQAAAEKVTAEQVVTAKAAAEKTAIEKVAAAQRAVESAGSETAIPGKAVDEANSRGVRATEIAREEVSKAFSNDLASVIDRIDKERANLAEVQKKVWDENPKLTKVKDAQANYELVTRQYQAASQKPMTKKAKDFWARSLSNAQANLDNAKKQVPSELMTKAQNEINAASKKLDAAMAASSDLGNKMKIAQVAAEKAIRGAAATEKAAASKILAEKVAAYNAAVAESAGALIAAQKASGERIAAQKSLTEKIAAEKAASERASAEKSVAGKAAVDKSAAEKLVSEKAGIVKNANEKIAAAKVLAEKATADRVGAEKTIAATPKDPKLQALANQFMAKKTAAGAQDKGGGSGSPKQASVKQQAAQKSAQIGVQTTAQSNSVMDKLISQNIALNKGSQEPQGQSLKPQREEARVGPNQEL